MSIEEIECEIAATKAAIEPLNLKLGLLVSKLIDAKSSAFIAANRITRMDVQFSYGDGMQHFGHIRSFAQWLKATRCTKRWAEWNGVIHHTSDIIAERFIPTDGRTDRL